MLRLRVNYLSSSSKSTNPPEFTVLLRPTSSSALSFYSPLLLLLPLPHFRPTLCRPRFFETLDYHTQSRMRATRSNSSLSPIFRGPRYRRKWSKTGEIFFHDRTIISNRFSCSELSASLSFSRSIRSASPFSSWRKIARNLSDEIYRQTSLEDEGRRW